MTDLEKKLQSYKNPSSSTEQDKQDRAERMVRNAVGAWAKEQDVPVSYTVKGSYANNTNVRTDSDVDIAVVHGGLHYYDDKALRDEDKVGKSPITIRHFEGANFRRNLQSYLKKVFGDACDITGSTAIELSENTSRVSADIVPSYSHITYYYNAYGRVAQHNGNIVYRLDGSTVINYPEQQKANGIAKSSATGTRYKQIVRILKRLENDLVAAGSIKPLPSYFMECLAYRVPNAHFGSSGTNPLTADLISVVAYIFTEINQGRAGSWLEPNEIKPLFASTNKWTAEDAKSLMLGIWTTLDLENA
jgi:predicted nucleotidyltransferase